MKKIILAAALLITVSASFAVNYTNANTVTTHINAKRPRPIPQPCVDSYNAMYPGATTIKWARKGETVYQVTFIYGGVKMTASYSADGTYLGK